MNTRIRFIKVSARIALGIVWLYEGSGTEYLFIRPDEIDLVQRSGLWWRSSIVTLQIMGVLQIAVGVWLLVGWKERAAVMLATLWMCGLIVLVGAGNPWMLTDPDGALIKDVCLIACALSVWILAPVVRSLPVGQPAAP